jgi:GTP diphosphokinase / guanosine-3',5'-bis(diphosphate) 3'-diphosphatase
MPLRFLPLSPRHAGPSKDWLNFVASPRARAKIKHHFTQERKELATEDGKEALVKGLRRQGLPVQSLINSESLSNRLLPSKSFTDVSALFSALGQGQISVASVIETNQAAAGANRADPSTEEIPITGSEVASAGLEERVKGSWLRALRTS